MVNDPKPPVHDQLTAYAAERRRQMGVPWALPPHTRSALRAAVEQYSDAEVGRQGSWWGGWCRSWPSFRWAAVAFSALAAVGFWWVALGPWATRPVELAQNDLPRVNPPTSVPARAIPPVEAPPPPAATPASAAPTDSLAVNRAVPAPTVPVASATRARSAPSADVRPKDRPEGAPSAPSVAPRIAGTPTATRLSTAKTGVGLAQPAAVAALSFSRVADALERDQQVTVVDRVGVLDRFRIESSGSTLRIIDSDGSVYEGVLANTAPAPPSAAPPGAAAAAQRTLTQAAPAASRGARDFLDGSPAGSARSVGPQAQAPLSAVLTPRGYRFEAAGTNLTTRRSVQVEGTIVVTNHSLVGIALEPLPTNRGVDSLQLLLQNSVVRAQVVSDGGQTRSVEAVPSGP